MLLLALFLVSCKTIQVKGNYTYVKSEKTSHLNSISISHTNTIFEEIPIVIKGKLNHDPIHKDRPTYQETSFEFWFW